MQTDFIYCLEYTKLKLRRIASGTLSLLLDGYTDTGPIRRVSTKSRPVRHAEAQRDRIILGEHDFTNCSASGDPTY